MSKKYTQILFVILIIALVWFVLKSVNQSISNAINPLQQANNAVATQIAELLHPTPTIIPDPVTIIHEVRSLARLETIQYTVEKVITAEIGQGPFAFLFEDRLLLVAHGMVIAGIDLEKLTPQDMWLDGSVLTVRLPDAEVFIATLNNEKTYVYERDTGILRKTNQDLETLARQSAEKEIRDAAIKDGILDMARQNGEAYLSRFFRALGYADVIFVQQMP
ncbi:MAG: hypothetical protein A2X25_03640 [Chloroflexi bacterium GWB2_49_20]|nr:MAG: hypothetical protein A2X25_03640 [Chloroflexi bacterium GWB2_49_20]OGN76679.1 MAG: hypothetical protein A2X26_10730 [Chloroflexi bacterium GWC2_49_37]OGN83639.1 MAG: hypothetical protein A2X27_01385 [Chloroflexi bacterium GWD2_49_16]HBG74239.1 hypothetical protein [Anaerolineae bacterium]HCC79445.1 hypothetical protein [Anaerolineae bacterium]